MPVWYKYNVVYDEKSDAGRGFAIIYVYEYMYMNVFTIKMYSNVPSKMRLDEILNPDCLMVELCGKKEFRQHTHTYIYIYIYIHV